MKPLTNNNISFLGGVGLLILFSLPYVGNLALIICAFFIPAGSVRTFARGCLIFVVVAIVVDVIIMLLTDNSFFFEYYYEFPLLNNEGLEAFRNILNAA